MTNRTSVYLFVYGTYYIYIFEITFNLKERKEGGEGVCENVLNLPLATSVCCRHLILQLVKGNIIVVCREL